MTHQLSVHTPSVIIRNHRPITTSTAVAEFFGKQHKNVIQKIETLDCSPDFASANFSADVQSVSIGNGAKRESKIYEMTKDGFVFLVMGFTGKKAAAFKEAYIAEFNRMEAQILHQRPEQVGYLGRSHKNISREEIDAYNINALSLHYREIFSAWREQIYPALRQLESPIAGRLYDRFIDGAAFLSYVERSLNERLLPGQRPRIM
ncbi:Rha family transcriptional regulator [Edwardsiella ictaluri]|uniref:Rha family transcriptional regulator n=1 Tax=Edwardsiella ictaluri TaxID=67780 RepID=A0ABY8GG69_EDWIC|nr:Rha family transcriptional regulator [Edwardsiella ictaluri]ELV7529305.1 Rha family transcriptional regulator [Edwardsiella ictaluri]WFN96448.1 Rha family transcriptional regulator [Edwardsiella ictaluri]